MAQSQNYRAQGGAQDPSRAYPAHVAAVAVRGIEEIGAQADEGLNQLCETARQQADEAQRMTEALAQEAREGLQRGGEQLRGQMQEGMARQREAVSAAGEEKEKGRHKAAA